MAEVLVRASSASFRNQRLEENASIFHSPLQRWAEEASVVVEIQTSALEHKEDVSREPSEVQRAGWKAARPGERTKVGSLAKYCITPAPTTGNLTNLC